MITAHAPAGYIGAQLLRRLKPAQLSARAWSLYGAISGILPDVDMLWFYLVDHRRVHHHRYLTHWPSLWLLALVIIPLYFAGLLTVIGLLVVIPMIFLLTVYVYMRMSGGDVMR